jgi:4-amino-4-deoxy-L-arabinose transferase-like glycosyltransferase
LGVKRLPAGAALWAVLAVALGLRLGAAFWWQSRLAPGQGFEFGDSEAYWVLAAHIAHGEPYEYGSSDARLFRMPGYPALLAVMLRVFGDNMPVLYARFESAVFGTAAVACVYWLASLVFDRRTGLLAAIMAACYPGAIAMSVTVLSEAPFCPLFLAQLAAWIKSWQCKVGPASGTSAGPPAFETERRREGEKEGAVPLTPSPRLSVSLSSLTWAAASGVLGGLATLMRPDWLLFVPFASVAGLFFTMHHRKHSTQSFVMLFGVVVVMTPWWWRNLQQGYRFVPTTLQVGASLYDGLNPRATGASDMWFVPEFVEEQRGRGPIKEPFEAKLDRRMFHAAVKWASENPARVIELAAVKFVRMWNIWPNNPENGGGLARLVTAATYLPAIVLALCGMWRTRVQIWPSAVCWLPAVYLTLLHMIFVSSIRYREPPMLCLLVFAAAALTRGGRPSPVR